MCSIPRCGRERSSTMPTRLEPNDPREWLNRAKSSLLDARSRAEGVYWEELCFDAEQAAEKAIKAVLIFRKAAFPYVHDLERLLSVLAGIGEPVPERVWRSKKLTPFAIEARYPSVAKEVTEAQYAEAVEIAESVVRWAEQIVLSANPTPN